MKKLLSLTLAIIMLISIVPTSFAEGTGLDNFTKKSSYTQGQFKDVSTSDWFSPNVALAYELGLMKGTSETTFAPKGNITVAETFALACRIHSIYNTGSANFTESSPWYDVYYDYAKENGLNPRGYYSPDEKISRANFAYILYHALPAEALKEINNIPDGFLLDIEEDIRTQKIYALYRAGIITGNDKYGTFNPDSSIQRSEVATIATRMADLSLRKMFILEEPVPVPIRVDLVGTTVLHVGESTQWKNSIFPAKANQWVSWTSGNPSVATIDANGNIKALKEGQSAITATAVNGVKKTVNVTVKSFNTYARSDLAWLRSHMKNPASFSYSNVYARTVKSKVTNHNYVLTWIFYRGANSFGAIISDSMLTIHDLNNNKVIYDAIDYYDDIQDDYYGYSKLHYMDCQIEALGWCTSTSGWTLLNLN